MPRFGEPIPHPSVTHRDKQAAAGSAADDAQTLETEGSAVRSRRRGALPVKVETRAGTLPGTGTLPGAGALPGGRRVVAVADSAFADRLDALLNDQTPCIRVPGFLSAMGLMTTRQPPDVIVGPAGALAGMAGSTARALRRLAPRARLVLVRDENHHDEADQAMAAGFDLALAADLSDHELAAALDLPAPPGADQPHAAHEADAPPDDPADLSTLDIAPPLPPPLPEISMEISPSPEQPPQQPPQQSPQQPSELLSGALAVAAEARGFRGPSPDLHADLPLGDTDLVEHVLRGRGGLRGLAMRVVREQSNLPPGLAFAEPEAEIPSDHAAAAVAYRDHVFGRLHAPAPATAQDLAAWGHWLARWLRLEDQFIRLRDLSMKDELTGVYNRRYFNRFLHRIIESAAESRQQVTLLLFDIDDFKHYNDNYGHAAGDEILREVAKLIQGSVREHDVVARIGGDEFAVIFWDAGQPRKPHSKHPDDVRNAAQRFQRAVLEHRFPKLMNEAAGNLTISGGLAGFPWDGRTPEQLLEFADTMAFQSKRQGKNAINFGPGPRPEDDEA